MKCALKCLVLVGVVGLAVVGCSGVRVEGNGVKASEERQIGSFSEVNLSGIGELVIVPTDAASPSLIVTADENLLEYVEAKSAGKTLTLRTKSGYWLRPKTPIKFTLMAKQVTKVSVSGAGDATVDGMTVDGLTGTVSGAGNLNLRGVTCRSLTLTLSGAGNATATGTTRKLTAKVSGAGEIDAAGLQADEAEVQISGAGNISAWATDRLKARVSGAGDVKYKGSPKVEKKVSGAGSITAMTE